MELPEPYSPEDKNCFAYETVVKRWPVIIANVIDVVYKTNHDLEANPATKNSDTSAAKVSEGKSIIATASRLKYEMARDKPLEPIPEDHSPDIKLYNEELQKLEKSSKNTWFTAPWLFAECYLYRLMRTWFSLTQHWNQFDPFLPQKEDVFKSSGVAVYQLAYTMAEIDKDDKASTLDLDFGRLEMLFDEMIQMCLWGNATDLSLLPTMSSADIEQLQSVGKEAQAASRKFILRDDIGAAWDYVKGLRDARLDIVLDNSGFELFTDLILGDFLVTHTPFFNQVIYHPKLVPWFVSDVTPPDARGLLASLAAISSTSRNAYFNGVAPSDDHVSSLHRLVLRWLGYFESGVFKLAGSRGLEANLIGGSESLHDLEGSDYWIRPDGYRSLTSFPKLAGLEESSLVIFKGDLNYRKLTGDLRWPATTTLEVAFGSIAGRISLLSLRTCKADVVVGLEEGLDKELDDDPSKNGWRTSGRYALISFVPVSTRPA